MNLISSKNATLISTHPTLGYDHLLQSNREATVGKNTINVFNIHSDPFVIESYFNG